MLQRSCNGQMNGCRTTGSGHPLPRNSAVETLNEKKEFDNTEMKRSKFTNTNKTNLN